MAIGSGDHRVAPRTMRRCQERLEEHGYDGPLPLPVRLTGFHAASQLIPASGVVVLVASDALGEGAVIVERMQGVPMRKNAALRASKILATSDWEGEQYELGRLRVSLGPGRSEVVCVP